MKLGFSLEQKPEPVQALAARDPAFPARLEAAAREAKILRVSGNLYNEAVRHHRDGNLVRASQLLERVLDNEPQHFGALISLGSLRRSQGKLYESVLFYQRALKVNAKDAGAHLGLGKSFDDLGWVQTAEAHFKLALEANPYVVDALVGLSKCLIAQARYNEAVVACQEAILNAPDCPPAHQYLQIALAGTGHEAGAETGAETDKDASEQAEDGA